MTFPDNFAVVGTICKWQIRDKFSLLNSVMPRRPFFKLNIGRYLIKISP